MALEARAHVSWDQSEMISHIIELEGTKDYVFSSVSGRLFPLIPFMIPFLPFFSLVPLNEYNWSLLWWIIPFFPFSLSIMFPLRMLSGEVFQLVRGYITKSGLISMQQQVVTCKRPRGRKTIFYFFKNFFILSFVSDLRPVMVQRQPAECYWAASPGTSMRSCSFRSLVTSL